MKQLEKLNEKYLGKIFKLNVNILDENRIEVLAGTLVRIVAIAPKVTSTEKQLVKMYPYRYDHNPYFYNAVRADQKEDYGGRIRANFITLEVV